MRVLLPVKVGKQQKQTQLEKTKEVFCLALLSYVVVFYDILSQRLGSMKK